MIGSQYWSTGPILHYYGDGDWGVVLNFFDDGFCNQESTQGEIRSRYISKDIDLLLKTILEDSKKLNIKLLEPNLFVYQDGEYKDLKEYANMPENWRENLSHYAKNHKLKWIYS